MCSGLILFSLTSCVHQEVKDEKSVFSDASMSEIFYHITFVNDDNSLLFELDVLEGETATYGGETPIKEEDDEFTYEFIGWDKDLSSIHHNLTTRAEYKAVAKEGWSEITWFN